MAWYRLAAGEPFGDLFFCVEDERLVEVTTAYVAEAEPAPAGWQQALREHLQGVRRFPLEMDLSSVPSFHRAVMRAAMEIPCGETATYGQLAVRAGRPGAARAAGSAMARNPFVLLVPCHRVVPASGGIGNYGSGDGSRMKARLLAWEKEAARGID
jgi:methylated-DNA-[protein]-cysteine S-methyltransferase